jgi:hypothetical protein
MILSLFARGMSTRDISEVYGATVSPDRPTGIDHRGLAPGDRADLCDAPAASLDALCGRTPRQKG